MQSWLFEVQITSPESPICTLNQTPEPTIAQNTTSSQSEGRLGKYVSPKPHFGFSGDKPMIQRSATPEIFSAKYSAHCHYHAIRSTYNGRSCTPHPQVPEPAVCFLVPRASQHTNAQHSAQQTCIKMFSDRGKTYVHMTPIIRAFKGISRV
jgi:hypothetical protein